MLSRFSTVCVELAATNSSHRRFIVCFKYILLKKYSLRLSLTSDRTCSLFSGAGICVAILFVKTHYFTGDVEEAICVYGACYVTQF